MARRMGICALVFTLMAVVGVAVPAGASGQLKRYGGGVARVGPVTYTNTSGAETDHFPGADLTGKAQLDGIQYVGPMHLGAVNVFYPACDVDCPPATISAATGLHGVNSSGQHVDGTCSQLHWPWFGIFVVASVQSISGQCSVRVDGVPVHTFPLTVYWGVGLGKQTGMFCLGALDVCGAPVDGGFLVFDVLGLLDFLCPVFNPVGPGC